ncbi:MAG: RNA methyltransferase [Bacteroidetes bacterium RIFOXYA12_FULL_35_11]|nr:MAG: RNA methyltransferase [Bacteroidetes bacterium GWF2_35_48]OFY73348.1 MAG: RNA methyltransferase [Bacteroidetes bacterium RIFOXYA12_FULL_35_11]OFY93697.1 MAG: RNA methyltransferase [Bacteroidetes bacterium RIFOXYC12_FULL_35_7]OFY95921.1 MAG: RNA methyltransferase [Bacteroidetes bacterium RIFOXYB2_FULL_35_7]HBX52258.1 RNA methyltransferase [Bacteroidales bacterium]
MRKLKNEELGRPCLEEFKTKEKTPIVLILDNVRSLNNIGSIFRTADAFAIEKIILCGITGTPPNKEISKTALGATESMEWSYCEKTSDAIQKLKQETYFIIAVEQVENSIALNDFSIAPEKKYAIIFGHEIRGVEQEVIDQCDACIEIPQFGTKHSFNVSVSAGIVLWDLFNKLQ